MKRTLLFLFTIALSILPAYSGSRSSTNYSIPADSTDAAGTRAQSANYWFNGNAVGEFGAGGTAVVTSTDYTGKNDYVGELYDLVALSITASSTNLNETASRQLAAAPLADDATTLAALNPATVAWSVVNGPLAAINTSGLATAGSVYQDTPATAGGSAQSLSGQLVLNIINVGQDDFGPYGGDGIDDNWQVQYFGQPPNANAGPLLDPDFDGHNNLFEFTAGIDPTNALSVFNWRIEPVTGQPAQKKIIFSPLVGGRTYTVKTATTLGTPMTTLTGSTFSDLGNERTITDTSATGGAKFYTVEIVKP